MRSLIAPLLLISAKWTNALTFEIPSSPPAGGNKIDPTPVGVSIEFFAFPDYIEKLPLTNACLATLEDVLGAKPPIRIGGTTQDRALYDASLQSAVDYTVDSPDDAPDSLTFGDRFMELAGSYEGEVTIGLNRRLDDVENTIAAAKVVQSKVGNLYAIELGNEPNFFKSSDPIAHGEAWTAAADAASQVSWQTSVSEGLDNKQSFVQAGVFFDTESFTAENLAAKEEETGSTGYVRSFCHHFYPQSSSNANLSRLIDHADIVDGVATFESQVAAAQQLNLDFIMGETNSATQGGGGISPTYGAGLWILDYIMQSTMKGIQQLFFHQGTIGNCQYCWWQDSVNAPFYGAYTAALALSGASQITQLDAGDSRYAGYAIYDGDGHPTRVLLYNSDYYASGTRSSINITLTGIPSSSTVSAKRLTADAATVVGQEGISIGGQAFGDGSCELEGEEDRETIAVENGRAEVGIRASEALLIYL
ncbi:hypothetical protein P170DRAFT_501658 [Aspergillus steynii IBT 23096]|uniref:Beta-glucuronidase C-terminal domain-containing protein n=1 Tax=Aspergillus steynii IBT 23096 TaxID=1392250 RepID=A0A2I2FW53_9EURO|nr:uncharacterized protein P170DRAFT_501658 [Aspergillus steynii IBT 23096]PLB44796.1 hypothetical protein P170DRAFT_501658 [Aspergillus steynii IBT 23096]